MSRLARIAATIAATALLTTACGGAPATYVAQSPVYGASGRCYYLDDPYEVTRLKALGRCPSTWVAYPAPADWEASHYWQYGPSYVQTYVVPAHRTIVIRQVQAFGSTHRVVTVAPRTRAMQPQPTRRPAAVPARPVQAQPTRRVSSGGSQSGGFTSSRRTSSTGKRAGR